MSIPEPPPIIPGKASKVTPEATLRKLFMTLFLRGRTSQGLGHYSSLNKSTGPTSIAKRLGLILALYAFMGLTAFLFWGQPMFGLSAYLHAMTFMCLGMFLVSTAGETLFNKEEGEILLHRPVTAQALLWAKVSVLIQISLYLAFALNLGGLFAGFATANANWLYPFAHAASTAVEALFCASCIVLVYQLCLKWFGRERMENMMTMMQVVVMAVFIIGSQVVPRVLMTNMVATQFGQTAHVSVQRPLWLYLIPPGWFAGFDDAIAGSHSRMACLLALVGAGATALVVWLAFGKLAKTYESGWQSLNESAEPKIGQTRGLRRLTRIAQVPPLRWWLKGSIERMSFVLVSAYLLRDRETKLRVYPSITSALMMPIVMAVSGISNKSMTMSMPHAAHGSHAVSSLDVVLSTFGVAFGGAFIGFIPMTALSLLSYSQQWKASEMFRAAPMLGPWALQRGAQVAVILILSLPTLILLILLAIGLHQGFALPLLIPGVILVPLYALIPAVFEGSIPLAKASEEAKSMGRGCLLLAAMPVGFVFAAVAIAAYQFGLLTYMILGEMVIVGALCWAGDNHLKKTRWRTME